MYTVSKERGSRGSVSGGSSDTDGDTDMDDEDAMDDNNGESVLQD